MISGLFNKAATGVGIHPGQTGNVLSGAQLQKGAELRGDISVDQVLANAIGQETVQPSLVLGCEQPTTGYHETNFSMAYSSHISWQNATSPVPMEVYPALAFDSQGNVYYAGLGFNRTSPPNTVAVNKGTFDGSGHLTWGPPTFINPARNNGYTGVCPTCGNSRPVSSEAT